MSSKRGRMRNEGRSRVSAFYPVAILDQLHVERFLPGQSGTCGSMGFEQSLPAHSGAQPVLAMAAWAGKIASSVTRGSSNQDCSIAAYSNSTGTGCIRSLGSEHTYTWTAILGFWRASAGSLDSGAHCKLSRYRDCVGKGVLRSQAQCICA